ncbi:oligopeptide/dipeptide ABC transporter ATP-binding protein [Dehalogenimonas sp. 4OHTPN]|uniref:Oligopeptide/dipeptide ABC transporter ATP-binding protein n=1 Tax=Dehalogenimonas sp. 4OHTPN TaxID=3166643 RepID=A0AAU8GDX2_9CHLR
MTSKLELNNVTMDFKAKKSMFKTSIVRAVDEASISLAPGETLGIVGESGSGKTTLARIALRLLRPTAGTVMFDGSDITNQPEKQLKDLRRRVQGVFQDPFASLDPFMTIGQILEEPLVIHKIGDSAGRKDAAARVLDEVKLRPANDYLGGFTHLLSGGQRQRVAIARALLLKPEYIVADEPVSMIDASSRAEILSLFSELQRSHNLGFLYITHDIATAGYFCHRIAVMYLGRIVETGPARELIRHPQHPYTQALIAAIPTPDPQNRFRERAVIPLETASSRVNAGCAFFPRCLKAEKGRCDTIKPVAVEVAAGHRVECLRL